MSCSPSRTIAPSAPTGPAAGPRGPVTLSHSLLSCATCLAAASAAQAVNRPLCAPRAHAPEVSRVVGGLGAAREREAQAEQEAREALVETQQGPRGVQDVVRGLHGPRHAVQAHGVDNQRHVIGGHADAALADRGEHAADHLAKVGPRAVPAAFGLEERLHVVGERLRVRVGLLIGEGEHVLCGGAAVPVAHRVQESKEVLLLLPREDGHHAQVHEHQHGEAAPLCVQEDIPRVEVRVHEVVREEHLEVDVLPADHDEVARLGGQGRGARRAGERRGARRRRLHGPVRPV
mmetsp:Transcript_2627/g.8654  ORF Transcript_2627/g.8654 Transcript_2627/m.8654 type:complete len:290 (-) Transcript_2627:888-1757(-)